MRAWISFLSVVVFCQILSHFAVGGSLGAESPPPPSDAPIVDAGPDAPIVDAGPDAAIPDARVFDAPVAQTDAPVASPPDAATRDAPLAASQADDGGCHVGGAASGVPAALLVLALLAARRARPRRRDAIAARSRRRPRRWRQERGMQSR